MRLRPRRPPDRRQRPARHVRLRVPDLRRLRRLFEHRARHVEADGHRAHRELPVPVSRAHAAGLLAALAHQPVHLAARLPLHPARRQPRVAPRARAATCSSRWCSAGCGTARRGRSSSGALYQGLLLIAYRGADRVRALHAWLTGDGALARITSWAVMFHLTCFGWLIFRARSARQLGEMSASLVHATSPRRPRTSRRSWCRC